MTTPPLALRNPSAEPDFSYETSPELYLFTSLTAGSSHIITATSRLETILKANRIPFKAVDIATDEKARRIWGRRAGKRKLPGVVKGGEVLGDLETVEEWNEYGEIKENLGGGGRAPVIPPQLQQSTSTQATTPASQPAVEKSAKPTEPSQAEPKADSQSSQQSQQAALAAEVAAIAKSRGGFKSVAKSTAAEDGSIPAHKKSPELFNKLSTSPRSPEGDVDFDMEDPMPKHNTSQHIGFPPLVDRSKPATPDIPDEALSPATDLELEDDTVYDGAAPAKTSEVEAVTDNVEEIKQDQHGDADVATDADTKAAETEADTPEAAGGKDEVATEVTADEDKAAPKEQHVTFEENGPKAVHEHADDASEEEVREKTAEDEVGKLVPADVDDTNVSQQQEPEHHVTFAGEESKNSIVGEEQETEKEDVDGKVDGITDREQDHSTELKEDELKGEAADPTKAAESVAD